MKRNSHIRIPQEHQRQKRIITSTALHYLVLYISTLRLNMRYDLSLSNTEVNVRLFYGRFAPIQCEPVDDGDMYHPQWFCFNIYIFLHIEGSASVWSPSNESRPT